MHVVKSKPKAELHFYNIKGDHYLKVVNPYPKDHHIVMSHKLIKKLVSIRACKHLKSLFGVEIICVSQVAERFSWHLDLMNVIHKNKEGNMLTPGKVIKIPLDRVSVLKELIAFFGDWRGRQCFLLFEGQVLAEATIKDFMEFLNSLTMESFDFILFFKAPDQVFCVFEEEYEIDCYNIIK